MTQPATEQPQSTPAQDQQTQPQASSVSPDALTRALSAATEAINSLPDRVVDALRESGASPQQQQAGKEAVEDAAKEAQGQQPQAPADQKADVFDLGKWWFGTK